MKKDPLSVAIDKFEKEVFFEADVLSVYTETRQAYVRVRTTSQSFNVNLGHIDPHLVQNNRARLLLYMGPRGNYVPIGIVMTNPFGVSNTGVSLGDSFGSTKFRILNSMGDEVFSVDSTGLCTMSSYTSSSYFNIAGITQIPFVVMSPSTYLENESVLTSGDGIDIIPSSGVVTIATDLATNSGLDIVSGELAMGTPATLTVSTSNTVSGTTHAHNITSNSNPGSSQAILATDSDGYLHLRQVELAQTGTGDTKLLYMDPADTDSKFWNWAMATAVQTGRDNVTLNWGYNNASAGREDSGDKAFYLQMESFYTTGGEDYFEYHLNYIDGSNDFRPFQWMVSRTDQGTSYVAKADTHQFLSRAGTGGMAINPGSQVLTTEYFEIRKTSANALVVRDGSMNTVLTVDTDYKNVGIGFNAPQAPLHIRKAAVAQVRIDYDATYYTTLYTISTGDFEIEPSGGDLRLKADLDFVGAHEITTTSDDLTIAPADDLILDPVGNDVLLNPSVDISTDNWTSGTTGWGITYAGAGDFRSLYSDELHVQSFIADIYSALAGGLVITKSRSRVTRDFTIPNTSSSATLYVEDLEGIPDTAVFEVNDYVCLKVIDTSGGGLVVDSIYGQVTSYSDLSGGEQSWTFTTTTTGYSSADVIFAGSIALDYGAIGDGVWEVTVLDQGLSPYSQVQTWGAVSAQGEPDTFTTWVRTGNLDGLAGIGAEYGLYAGDGLSNTDSYVLVTDSQVDLHNLPLTIHDGSNTVIKLDNTTPYFSLGTTAPTAYGTGDGIWMGNDSGTYKFRVGAIGGKRLQWDGTDLWLYTASGTYLRSSGSDLEFYAGGAARLKLYNTGLITVGPESTGEYLDVSATNGLRIYSGGNLSGQWQADGDIFIGSNIAAPATTYFSIFATAQTYNSESMEAGDMLIGDNTSSKANILWDKSAGELKFRGGTTTEVYIDTNGRLVAGDGDVSFSSGGLGLVAGSGDTNAITWHDSGYTRLQMWTNGAIGAVEESSNSDSLVAFYVLSTADASGSEAWLQLLAASYTTQSAGINLTGDDGASSAEIELQINYTTEARVISTGLQVNNGLVVGSLTTTPYDNDIYAIGGLALGNMVDPGQGDILATGGASFGYTSADPGDGNVVHTGSIKPRRGTTTYTGAIPVYLSSALAWSSNGSSFSDVGTSTEIDHTAWGGGTEVPATAKALLIYGYVRDSASASTSGLYFALYPNSSTSQAAINFTLSGKANDDPDSRNGWMGCDAGDIWYQCNASGTNTLDVWLWCWGYSL